MPDPDSNSSERAYVPLWAWFLYEAAVFVLCLLFAWWIA